MAEDPISDALKMMPYGFYSITSKLEGDLNIMVANWIIQASFEPRLMVLALQKTSYSYRLITQGKVFAVNIFNQAGAEAIKPFTKSRVKKPEKVEQAGFLPGPQTGCPILKEASAYLECRVVQVVETGGDHNLVIGEVVGGGVQKPGDAKDMLTLPFLGWSYAG